MKPYARPDPLEITQGCTFEKSWQWTAGGKPVDLTGAEFELVAKADAGATDTLLFLTTGTGIAVTGSTFTVRIESDITRAYARRSAVFNLRVRWPGPEPRRVDLVMTGTIVVKPGVLAP
ncbi:LtfC-like domain-containing protein [Paludibacterium denitrificans]|uniref:LtfC-like domain-containing protein n=1 Tax=Paludibacterium denitrificans TaxID=2675226 RepID=UPI001E3CBD54|nr:hypothetical protein [Paludibacterium denitrificans]